MYVLFSEAKNNGDKATPETQGQTTSTSKVTNASSLSNNPFLPMHVRQRLQQDASNKHSNQDTSVNASYTKQLVDQLVAHHLPTIEQELRRKLLDVVKQHNDIVKK